MGKTQQLTERQYNSLENWEEAIYAHKVHKHQRSKLWQQTASELLTEYAAPNGDLDHVVLDFGCGPGELSRLIRQQCGKVFGVDISAMMVEHASAAVRGVNFSTYGGKFLPYPSGKFDRVYCMHVLGHVPDLDGTLHELARVLVPGGFICVANPNKWNTLLRRPQAWLRGYHPDPTIRNRFSAKELSDRMERHGLRTHKVIHTGEIINLPLPANIKHSMFLSYYRKE